MALTENQVEMLSNAIEAYNFPCVFYDFQNACEVSHPNMYPVEQAIRNDLVSGNNDHVKNGLSNVLYWGFAQVGYRDIRVNNFRTVVRVEQLHDAATIFQQKKNINLIEIKNIKLPQFSGMSFISKIAMFLDPKKYVVLDQQILKMNKIISPTILKAITFSQKETQIRISKNNVQVYSSWCQKCQEISESYLNGSYRAVDVERGFFTLIKNGRVPQAASILVDA